MRYASKKRKDKLVQRVYKLTLLHKSGLLGGN